MNVYARVVALVLAGVFFVGACGDDGAVMDDDAAAWLQAEVRAAREAVAAGDVDGALAALDRVDAAAVQFRDDDRLAPDRAETISADVAATREAIVRYASATSPATVATTVPAPPAEAGDGNGDGNGRGHGKDKKKNG